MLTIILCILGLLFLLVLIYILFVVLVVLPKNQKLQQKILDEKNKNDQPVSSSTAPVIVEAPAMPSESGLYWKEELSHLLNHLQDAIESGEENSEYAELEINTGKFRILQGRLKALSKRLDNDTKGYLLSCIVNMGLANNPIVVEDLDFSGSLCSEEVFFAADLSRIVAHGIDMSNSILSEARLEGAKLSFANLNNSRLDEVRAAGAYINDAQIQMSYLKGADLQRTYLIETNLGQSYLSEANLDGAIMRRANLELANIGLASLNTTNLSEANLYKAILKSASLQTATLSETNLQSAYLGWADFDSADLWRANLSYCIMISTNFQGAYLNETKFHGVYKDLAECNYHELESLQDKNVGLFSSQPNDKLNANVTNFGRCQWWLADFDKDSARTLWPFLDQYFAPPNGLSLSENDWFEYDLAKEKITKLLQES